MKTIGNITLQENSDIPREKIVGNEFSRKLRGPPVRRKGPRNTPRENFLGIFRWIFRGSNPRKFRRNVPQNFHREFLRNGALGKFRGRSPSAILFVAIIYTLGSYISLLTIIYICLVCLMTIPVLYLLCQEVVDNFIEDVSGVKNKILEIFKPSRRSCARSFWLPPPFSINPSPLSNLIPSFSVRQNLVLRVEEEEEEEARSDCSSEFAFDALRPPSSAKLVGTKIHTVDFRLNKETRKTLISQRTRISANYHTSSNQNTRIITIKYKKSKRRAKKILFLNLRMSVYNKIAFEGFDENAWTGVVSMFGRARSLRNNRTLAQARSLRSDRALARARSLRSDRVGRALGRYVATERDAHSVAT
ncbi:hypothetical protein F2Q69_00024160 [Brassica cretica]|uniref:Reticulon-like protein n=1 Tax=Brassica cretica TaxID=69181 RepID=A0A8S9QLZ0_BRACR|nr:hypothetical protein F2Q69_00024160 [Brassica cretica]